MMFLWLIYYPNSQSQRTINYFAYCQIYWVCSTTKVRVQVDILFFKNIKQHCTQVVVVSRRLWWCPIFCSWKIWRDWYQNCILSEWFKPDDPHNKTHAISFVFFFIRKNQETKWFLKVAWIQKVEGWFSNCPKLCWKLSWD